MSNKLALLSGIRIVDCGQFIPGPYVGLMCADLGADVVKVEPPAGDPLRHYGGLVNGVSIVYQMMNRGKTIVQIDLKTEDGRENFRQLIARADVLIESYRPGAFQKLGLDNKALSELNSKLVHATLTGYGGNGPYSLRAGHDLNYAAAAGILAMSGRPDQPLIAMPPTTDFAGALQTAFMISAALFARERTGKGVHLDVAMADVVLAWQSVSFQEQQLSKESELRGICTLNGGAAFYNVYKTKDDRFVTLAALEERFWSNFCQAAGQPNWIKRQFEPYPQMSLIEEVTALFGAHDLKHWSTLLDSVDCCFEPVCNLSDLPSHPQIQFRQMLSAQAASNSSAEPLFPVWVNGEPPAPRVPLQAAEVGMILERWCKPGYLGWS
jgi:alpha-methylacyl-CoA racemase